MIYTQVAEISVACQIPVVCLYSGAAAGEGGDPCHGNRARRMSVFAAACGHGAWHFSLNTGNSHADSGISAVTHGRRFRPGNSYSSCSRCQHHSLAWRLRFALLCHELVAADGQGGTRETRTSSGLPLGVWLKVIYERGKVHAYPKWLQKGDSSGGLPGARSQHDARRPRSRNTVTSIAELRARHRTHHDCHR